MYRAYLLNLKIAIQILAITVQQCQLLNISIHLISQVAVPDKSA